MSHTLRPYESARSLWKGDSWIFMDANESPVPRPCALDALPPRKSLSRPHVRRAARRRRGVLRPCSGRNLIMANGSDELIDLLVRAFVRPGRKVVSLSPSYGMYRVSAEAAGADFVAVPLRADFSVDEDAVLGRVERRRSACSSARPTTRRARSSNRGWSSGWRGLFRPDLRG